MRTNRVIATRLINSLIVQNVNVKTKLTFLEISVLSFNRIHFEEGRACAIFFLLSIAAAVSHEAARATLRAK